MKYELPKDLLTAEVDMYKSVKKSLAETNFKRISINMLFEGLKVNAIAVNLAHRLMMEYSSISILVSDQGNCALIKRDYPQFVNNVFTFKEYIEINNQSSKDDISISVSPMAFDYEEFNELCDLIQSPIIMINGNLEDTAIGIGSIGRDRRRNFIQSWNKTYWLQPLSNGAMMMNYPNEWQLYSLTEKGYSFTQSFKYKPDQETILSTL